MKDIHDYQKDIASIRTMMERSAKFLSLSGLAGVLAGVYALIGAAIAYRLVQYPRSLFDYRMYSIGERDTLLRLVLLGAVVLIASLSTGLWLSHRKAKKRGIALWNNASRIMLINISIPLLTGGIFVLIMLFTGHFGLAAPSCLVFYGLALVQGSSNTFDEIRYLGFCEIALGLVSALLPGYGLVFWAIGFGILHIAYGAVMYNKYDK